MMPVIKQDLEHVLHLLQHYHHELTEPEHSELKDGIKNIMDIFKSDLFGALIDVQEYYELMMQCIVDTKSNSTTANVLEKSASTLDVTETPIKSVVNERTMQEIPNKNNVLPEMYQGVEFPAYEYEDIVLERGPAGLGFSIAGGRDNPLEGDDASIYITKILRSGAAADDGRLRVNDAIISVNGVDTRNVQHKEAVEALKMCQSIVRLVVRRIPQAEITENQPDGDILDLWISKGTKGLGFSIAGGLDNQHIPGDNGIFITKIIKGGAAEEDGRLRPGDKIVEVDGVSLFDVPHEAAVTVLKATTDYVFLRILRKYFASVLPPSLPQVSRPESIRSTSSSVSKHEREQRLADTKPAVVSRTNDQHLPSSILPPEEMASTHIADEQQNVDLLSTEVLPPSCLPSVDDQNNGASNTEHDNHSSNHSNYRDVPRGPRTVSLSKGPDGLGFNVIGGEDDEGVFISYIQEGGVADVSGLLHEGDHILSVNDVNVASSSYDEAVKVLKSSGQSVVMVVEYNKPSDYSEIERTIKEQRTMNKSLSGSSGILTSQKKTLHVRALFDYNCYRDSGLPGKGLSFQHGDILHVTNASDDEWWQARRVEHGNDSTEFGVIPSKYRVERKERARLKQVKFTPSYPQIEGRDLNNVKRKKSLLFSRKFPFYKSRENLDEVSDQENNVPQSDLSDDSEKDAREETVLSYENVTQKQIKYSRPIIILGPFKDRINDDLIAQEPELFGSCVPHTTREKRPDERDGHDYHFVTSRDQMETDIKGHLFIEAGQYNENLYGTSVQSVKDVAESNKHCILDVSGSAIKRLQVADLWPISIFIKPRSIQWLMDLNKRLVEEQAKKIYERAMKCEQEFGELFTAVVQGETIDEIYNDIKLTVQAHSGPIIWTPVTQENS